MKVVAKSQLHEESWAAVREEAQLGMELDNDFIVKVKAWAEDEFFIYVVMEQAQGTSPSAYKSYDMDFLLFSVLTFCIEQASMQQCLSMFHQV